MSAKSVSVCEEPTVLAQWHAAEHKLQKACDQMDALSRRLTDLQDRYEAAKVSGREAVAYNTQLQLSVVEGTLAMYSQYATHVANQMTVLWEQVQQCPGFSFTDFEQEDMEMDLSLRI